MLSHWISQFGYWAVLLGAFFEGETIVLLAGYAAHRGYLSPYLVAVLAFIGSLAGDQLAYLLGWRFRSLASKVPERVQPRVVKVTRWFERHAILVMLGFRFVYGMRNVTPFAIGSMKVPARVFTPLNALGALVWATVFTGFGYAFGQLASVLFERAQRYEKVVMLAIIVVGLGAGIVHAMHQRVRQRGAKLP